MNTSQYTELERVKLKIKALAAKTVDNGATEHEAMAAMHVVGRLLNQYNLNMNELEVRDATYKTIQLDTGRQRRHPINHTVISLANLVGAKTWFSKGYKNSAFAFFGQETDLKLIEYLFKVILNAINNESVKFKHTDAYINSTTHRKSALTSFQKGMVSRISVRLDEIKKQNDAELASQGLKTGTALMVLKGQLTQEKFKETGIKLVNTYSYGTYNYNSDAYQSGREAGDRVNLSRPITKGKPKGYLT